MTIRAGCLFPKVFFVVRNIARIPLSMQVLVLLLAAFAGLWSPLLKADVVKPALVELTLYDDGRLRVEVRASIEAMLADISTRYKNTQDAPTAAEYDRYRAMQRDELAREFARFSATFLDAISLRFGGQKADLKIVSVDIPEPGYKKVPRISTIVLAGEVPGRAEDFDWTYPARFGDAAFRFRHYDPDEYTWSDWTWLRNGESTKKIGIKADYVKRSLPDIVLSYIKLGYLHIVPLGLDHILFILGIFLLSTRMKPLLWQVTAFTVAHTITLGLSMYGVISVPERIVQPLIALSIAYVGVENIFLSKLHSTRIVIVFLFGLLHGMGFASVLADFGMPKNDFVTALLSFNVGVELGQIFLLLAAWLLVALPFGSTLNYRKLVVIPGSALIAVMGLVWTIDRVMNG